VLHELGRRYGHVAIDLPERGDEVGGQVAETLVQPTRRVVEARAMSFVQGSDARQCFEVAIEGRGEAGDSRERVGEEIGESIAAGRRRVEANAAERGGEGVDAGLVVSAEVRTRFAVSIRVEVGVDEVAQAPPLVRGGPG
jgi:hypothetical protein